MDSQPLNPLQASGLKQYATWNSKYLPEESWQRTFKRENLGMHLSGLICAPSIVNLGAAKWISSLVDSHVSPIARQGSNDTETTQENSAEKSSELPESWGNQLSFWKTSPALADITLTSSAPNYERWAMKLRKDSTRRRKLVLLRRENGSSSWPTPTANPATYSNGQRGPNLIQASKNWPTPNTRDTRRGCNQKQLATEVDKWGKNWPTPNASEHKYRLTGNTQQSNGLTATARKHPSSLQVRTTTKDGHECSPRCLRLNPVFVECLMGFPLGISNVSEPLGMQSFQQWQLMLGSTLTELLKEK